MTNSATEAIRARVASRLKRGHLARTAEDHKLSLTALQNFATGGKLPEIAMHALVREFWPHNTRLDAVSDRLIDTRPPPLTLATAIPESVPDPRYAPPDPNREMVKVQRGPVLKPRPGFA